MAECGNSRKYIEEMKNIYHNLCSDPPKEERFLISCEELKTNRPSPNTLFMLSFLGGEFSYVKEHAMNVKAALGWSSTFMKCGLSAFLLMLYEGDAPLTACREMCQIIVSSVNFDKEEYEAYAGRTSELDTPGLFWQCFAVWKKAHILNEKEKSHYIAWIDNTIRERVEGIMGANRRNYYGECASYIAAFGEVLESQGNTGATQRIFREYKQLYPRRSAFHQALRSYGMVDNKR